jgi:hypothetical protein
MSETFLTSTSHSSFIQAPDLTPMQAQMDGLVSGFVDKVMDGYGFAGILVGGVAGRVFRGGTLHFGHSLASLAPKILSPVAQGVGHLTGFAAETLFFENSPRLLKAIMGNGNFSLLNLYGEEGIGNGTLHSAVGLLGFRLAGIASAHQSLCVQSLFQSATIMASHHTSALLGIIDLPRVGMGAQFIEAQAMVFHLWTGMRMLHQGAPRLAEWESTQDLSIQGLVSKNVRTSMHDQSWVLASQKSTHRMEGLLETPLWREIKGAELSGPGTPFDHSKIPQEMQSYRELFEKNPKDTKSLNQYLQRIPFLPSESPEVYLGAKAIRRLLKRQASVMALQAYEILSNRFNVEEKIFLTEEFKGLIELLENIAPTQYFTTDLDHKQKVVGILHKNFQKFHAHRLWNEVFDSNWFSRLKISQEDKNRIREMCTKQGQIMTARDAWKSLLFYLSDLTPAKQTILHALLEAGGKPKNIFSALRTLNLIPPKYQYQFTEEIASQINSWPQEISSKVQGRAARAKEHLIEALFKKLAANISGSSDPSQLWKGKKESLNNGILPILIRASAFMNEEGLKTLEKLLNQLAFAEVTPEGRMINHLRYKELINFGFDPEFVATWVKEYEKLLEGLPTITDSQEIKTYILKHYFRQISIYSRGIQSFEGKLGDLPKKVSLLLDRLQKGEVEANEVEKILEVFEQNYQTIRNQFGSIFSEIKMELKNLTKALQMPLLKMPTEVSIQVSGSPEVIGLSGQIPVLACQNLIEPTGLNERGQPLNRILHGQFKIVNFIADGQIVARRLLEVTRNAKGEEVLLIHFLYSNERFWFGEIFDQALKNYAHEIGVQESNKFFAEKGEEGVPLSMDTGDEVHRDHFRATIDPKKLPKKKRVSLPTIYSPPVAAEAQLQ